jgi:hypothetical protein
MTKTRKKSLSEKTRRKALEAMKRTRVWAWWFLAVKEAEDGDPSRLIKVLRHDFGASMHKVEQMGRADLATLLEGRDLTRKQGGQQTPMGRLSRGDRLARAAKIYRDLRAGRAIPTPLLNKGTPEMVERLPKTREEMERWRRSQPPNTAIGTNEVWEPPRLSPTEAIKIAAALMDENEERLLGYVRGETGYGRGRKK